MANFYEILGVAKNASSAEIRSAYVRLVKERHPDRVQDPVEKDRAQEFLKDLTAAFNTLSNDRSRQEYDHSLEKPRPKAPEEIAALAFAQGMKAYEAKAYHEAVELLRNAVVHAPEEPRIRAALGLALAKNPHWVRDAIQETERATQLDPQSATYQSQLAELFFSQGLRLRARKAAEAALRLNADDRRAQKIFAETSTDEPPSGSGLMGFLRRKP